MYALELDQYGHKVKFDLILKGFIRYIKNREMGVNWFHGYEASYRNFVIHNLWVRSSGPLDIPSLAQNKNVLNYIIFSSLLPQSSLLLYKITHVEFAVYGKRVDSFYLDRKDGVENMAV